MAVQAHMYTDYNNFGLLPPVPAFDSNFEDCDYLSSHQVSTSQLQQPSFSASPGGTGVQGLLSMDLSQSLASEFDRQVQEIDLFIQFQNHRLRYAINEQRKQQIAAVVTALEAKAVALLRQKEQELQRATMRTVELQAWLRKTEKECQSWQQMAQTNESVAMNLQSKLDQVREEMLLSSNGVDAESMCYGSCDIKDKSGAEQLEERQQEIATTMKCRSCNNQSSCVLFLPCMHLCSCKSCEAFLGFCPVCHTVKEGCLEVFMA